MENNSLTLIVKEKTLGSLTTNAKEIKAFVIERLEDYTVENYKGNVKDLTKARAELNAASKKLNDDRIALEKEWNAPFQEFKDVVTETTNLIKKASAKIDDVIKEVEAEEKAEKKAEIEKIWESKKFALVSLDRVFDNRWLNKTYKLVTVEDDIDARIKGIYADLQALDSFGEDTKSLKDLYLTTLNLQATLNKGAELKANRERLAAIEAEKQKRVEEEAQRQAEAETQEEIGKNIETADEEFQEYEESDDFEQDEQETEEENKCVFNLYGERKDVAITEAIALSIGLEIVPSLTLAGTLDEINKFKEKISNKGLSYIKSGAFSLEIKGCKYE